MANVTVYHNPRCSKSRRAVEILGERGVAFDTVDYLRTPPDRRTLEGLVALLPTPPDALVRRDARFTELGLDDASCRTAVQVVDLLLAHPELMERPVIVANARAVIARPPEKVLEILG